jgi:hypothetical protein
LVEGQRQQATAAAVLVALAVVAVLVAVVAVAVVAVVVAVVVFVVAVVAVVVAVVAEIGSWDLELLRRWQSVVDSMDVLLESGCRGQGNSLLVKEVDSNRREASEMEQGNLIHLNVVPSVVGLRAVIPSLNLKQKEASVVSLKDSACCGKYYYYRAR